jgi:hypothetical protein
MTASSLGPAYSPCNGFRLELKYPSPKRVMRSNRRRNRTSQFGSLLSRWRMRRNAGVRLGNQQMRSLKKTLKGWLMETCETVQANVAELPPITPEIPGTTVMVGYTKERCAGCGGRIRHDLRYTVQGDKTRVWRSPECQDGLPQKSSKATPSAKERRCVRCGKSLEGKRAGAKFCSPGCRLKSYRVETAESSPGNELSVSKPLDNKGIYEPKITVFEGLATLPLEKPDQPFSGQIQGLGPGNGLPCSGWNEEFQKLDRHGNRRRDA